MVNVPVANPWGLRLPNVRLGGRPVTVNCIPSCSSRPAGSCAVGSITWLETLGYPTVVTVNEPGVPTNMVAVFALLICGASFTFRTRDCVAVSPAPASSVNVTMYWPPVPAAGTPVMLAGLPDVKDSPLGSALSRSIVPRLAATPNAPTVPTVNVAVLGLVNSALLTTVTG